MIRWLALSPSVDITWEVPELARGGITRPTATVRVAGGKALNAARAARQLGAAVAALVPLGGAGGVIIARELGRDGIEVDIVPIENETRMCASIVETLAGSPESTDLYEPATLLSEREQHELLRRLADWSRRPAGVVALSGSVPQGVDVTAIARVLHDLRDAGHRIALDSSGEGLRQLVGVVDLVKINRLEAEELLGTARGSAAAACAAIADLFDVDVIVTDGVRGSAALFGHVATAVPMTERAGIFAVGSGDSYFASVLVDLDRDGRPTTVEALDAMLGRAARVAARNAAVPGPGRLAPEL